jgi:hypothetical protein
VRGGEKEREKEAGGKDQMRNGEGIEEKIERQDRGEIFHKEQGRTGRAERTGRNTNKNRNSREREEKTRADH